MSPKPASSTSCSTKARYARREEAKATLLAAKQAMGLSGVWNRISRGAERRRKKTESVA